VNGHVCGALEAERDGIAVIAEDGFPVDDKRDIHPRLCGFTSVEAGKVHQGLVSLSTTLPGSTASCAARRITSFAPP